MATDAKTLLAAANNASEKVATLHIAFLALCTYVLVIVFSTTDMDLLIGKGVKLPVVDVEVPITGFYALAPYLLVLVHFNLLLQLQLLSRKLFAFDNAATKEGTGELHDQLHIFPFTYYLVGRPSRLVHSLVTTLVTTTILLLPLYALLTLQARFLAYQNEAITWAQRLATWLDVALVVILWPVIMHRHDSWKAYMLDVWQHARLHWVKWTWKLSGLTILVWLIQTSPLTSHNTLSISLTPILTWILLGLFLFSARYSSHWLRQLRHYVLVRDTATVTLGLRGLQTTSLLGLLFPLLLTIPGEKLDRPNSLGAQILLPLRHLDLHEQILLANPAKPEVLADLRSDNPQIHTVALNTIAPINLQQRSLRFANLSKALLPKADLRQAQLQGAILKMANLEGADLSNANLQEATLQMADLQGVQLSGTQLQRADLQAAKLQGAVTTLQEPDYRDSLDLELLLGSIIDLKLPIKPRPITLKTQLEGANLTAAQLQGANLSYADLRGARLHQVNAQGASLRDAILNGADLSFAFLQGADLTNVHLKATDIDFTLFYFGNNSGVSNLYEFVTDKRLVWKSLEPGEVMELEKAATSWTWRSEQDHRNFLSAIRHAAEPGNNPPTLGSCDSTPIEIRSKCEDMHSVTLREIKAKETNDLIELAHLACESPDIAYGILFRLKDYYSLNFGDLARPKASSPLLNSLADKLWPDQPKGEPSLLNNLMEKLWTNKPKGESCQGLASLPTEDIYFLWTKSRKYESLK